MEEVINVVVLEDYKKLKWGKEKIVIPLAFTNSSNSTPNLREDLVPLFAQNGDLWFWVKDKRFMAYNIESEKINCIIWDTEASKMEKCGFYVGPSSLINLKGRQPVKK